MRFLTIVFSLLLIGSKVFSQEVEKTKIYGIVIDTAYHPIAYAALQIFIDDSVLTGTITDINGNYELKNLPSGKYNIKVSAIGYKNQSREIELLNTKKKFPAYFKLQADNINIDEIQVTATRTGVNEKIDKVIYSPDSISLQSAKTGIDIINRVPEVHVNKKDQSVSILGNSNVLVLVNGIDNHRNLASINPSDIDRIEVITHPSVKYRSDITSVINIILKDYKSQGITLNSNLYYCIDKKNHSGNFQIDYNINKWRFFGSYIGSFALTTSIDSIHRIEDNIAYSYYPLSNYTSDAGYNRIQYGFDFEPNKNNIFSFTSRFILLDVESFRNYRIISDLNQTKIKSDYSSNKTEQNYSLFYRHNFKNPDDKLTVNSNLYILNTESNSDVTDSIYLAPSDFIYNTNRLTISNNNQKSLNIRIDYEKSLKESINLEVGYQIYSRQISNVSRSTLLDNSELYYFDLRNSVYCNGLFKIKSFSFQTGLRIENSYIEVLQEDNNELKVLPFFSTFYKFNEKESLKFTYRYSLEYPEYSYLNPFKYFASDSMSYFSGNPYLKPEQKQNLDLKYSYKKNKTSFSTSLYYNYLNDLISQKISYDSTIISYKYANLGKASQVGLNVSYSTIYKEVEFEMSLRSYYIDYINKEHTGFGYAAEFGLYFPLFWGFDAEIYGVLKEKEMDYNGYYEYGGYIDEILISKDITNSLYIGLAVWQPFFSLKDLDYQWSDTYSETVYYTELHSTSFLINLTYNLKVGSSNSKKLKKDLYMESSKNSNKGIR